VAGVGHQPLDIDPLDAEAAGLGSAAFVGTGQFLDGRDRPHAAAAAAAQRLDHHAGAGVSGEELARLRQGDRARAAGQQRDAAFGRQVPGPRLVAEQGQLLHRGADEGDSRLSAGLREIGALAQEPVAGMDRVAAALARDRQQRRNIEIGGRPLGAQRHGFVGKPGVRQLRVVGRIDRDAGRAEVADGAHQPQGDLTAIRDQYLVEHQAASFSSRRSTLPAPVAGRASTKRTSRGAL
jgi:hypothetical protein